MTSAKIDRAEEAHWAPPILTFLVERHGALVMGSTKAELQHWAIDIESKTAVVQAVSTRQLRPRSPNYNAGADADAIVAAIANGKSHPNVVPLENGFSIRGSSIIPDNGPKQTVAARRKRLRAALRERLETLGYVEDSAWRFLRPSGEG